MSTSDLFGGWGGSPNPLECPAGHRVIQVYGRSGQSTDQLCVKCSNGATFCAGGQGGSPWYGPQCDYLKNFSVQSGQGVDAVYQPQCQDNNPGARQGGSGGSLHTFSCPTDMVLTGILTRSGAAVDQVQFKCANMCNQPGYLDWKLCQDYCGQNPSACGNVLKDWCIKTGSVLDMCKPYTCTTGDGSNLSKPECKAWCVANPGKCDDGAKAYCTANQSNTDFCGCFNYDKSNPNDDPTIAQTLQLPQCYVGSCAGGATSYKTTNYANPPACPALTICAANLGQAAGGGANMKNITVTQNCGNKSSTSSIDASSTSTSNISKTSTPGLGTTDGGMVVGGKSVSSTTLYAVGAAGIILVSCVIVLSILALAM